MNNYTVYLHTNLINNKKYCGITQQKSLNKRWQGGSGYKSNKHFYSAILKYGWESFSHEILSINLSAEEASQEEQRIIAELDLTNSKYGYNKTSGGERGYHRTDEWKENMRQKNLGSKNPNYGKSLSQEHRNKISQANRGKGHDQKWRETISKKAKKTPVICINTGEIFESQKMAGQWCGIKGKPTKIGECGRGKRKHAGKHPITQEPLAWKFVEQGSDLNED